MRSQRKTRILEARFEVDLRELLELDAHVRLVELIRIGEDHNAVFEFLDTRNESSIVDGEKMVKFIRQECPTLSSACDDSLEFRCRFFDVDLKEEVAELSAVWSDRDN